MAKKQKQNSILCRLWRKENSLGLLRTSLLTEKQAKYTKHTWKKTKRKYWKNFQENYAKEQNIHANKLFPQ